MNTNTQGTVKREEKQNLRHHRQLGSCFKQTSRCLLELSKTVFLSRNELTVVNKRKLFIILLKWGGAGGGGL